MEQLSTIPEILKLSVAERILIAEQIWDSITAEQEALPITEAQKTELDRRLDDYQASPEEGSSWNEIKNKLVSKK
jgi:putative addiction module component (TIGR02574 family)